MNVQWAATANVYCSVIVQPQNSSVVPIYGRYASHSDSTHSSSEMHTAM